MHKLLIQKINFLNCEFTDLIVFFSLSGSCDQNLQVVDDFLDPALFMPLPQSLSTHLGHNANTAANHGSLDKINFLTFTFGRYTVEAA